MKFLEIILKNTELVQGICKMSEIIINLTVYHHIHIYFDQLDDSLVSPDYPTSDHHINHLGNHPDHPDHPNQPHDNIHNHPNHPKTPSDEHPIHFDDHSNHLDDRTLPSEDHSVPFDY